MFDTRLSKRTKHCPSIREQKKLFKFFMECLMAFKFYQTRPNTIKHIQIRSNSTKQGVQTVKCLVTKRCLMVFGRQTFMVCPGPKKLLRRFQGIRRLKSDFIFYLRISQYSLSHLHCLSLSKLLRN